MMSLQPVLAGKFAYALSRPAQTAASTQIAAEKKDSMTIAADEAYTMAISSEGLEAYKSLNNVKLSSLKPIDNSLARFGKLLGLNGVFENKDSLKAALKLAIDVESLELAHALEGILGDLGLGDITKKIIFAEDADGNIVVEGNISAKDKQRIAELMNENPELVERIKTQKAKMEILEGLENKAFDLSDGKYLAARTQLFKDYLQKNGLLFNDAADGGSQKLDELLEAFSEFAGEIRDIINPKYVPQTIITADPKSVNPPTGEDEQPESNAVRSLLSIKRGDLSEAGDGKIDFVKAVADLHWEILDKVAWKIYNKEYARTLDEQIESFSMRIDHNGELYITDVQTIGNKADDNAKAKQALNSLLPNYARDSAKTLGLDMLEDHDDEHGDLKDFRHHISIGKDFENGYRIESPEADKAAALEMLSLMRDVHDELKDFFLMEGITTPFNLFFGADGILSLEDGSLKWTESQLVRKALTAVNDYLVADEAGGDTEGTLDGKLLKIAEKLVDLKGVQNKFHDRSLVPKDGFRFSL